MTRHDGFERQLSAWLVDEVGLGTPGYLDEVLGQTTAIRQRRSWLSIERWLPVDVPLQLRFVQTPRLGWLLVVLALVVALTAAIALMGSPPQLPPPFGPAANGKIVHGTGDGELYAFDPATGSSTLLIGGKTFDHMPLFSRDGSMFAFARASALPGRHELILAKADGTIVRSLTNPFIPAPETDWAYSLDWSPDGSRLALIESTGTFSIVSADGSGARAIDLGMAAQIVRWLPDGRELIFKGVSSVPGGFTVGLYAVGADGSGLRAIVPPTTPEGPGDFQAPALSPDGTRIIYARWDGDAYSGGNLYMVDVDGGEAQRLIFEDSKWSEYFADWSPDGSMIVFNRGRPQESYHLSIAPAGGGQVVDIGPEVDWGAAAIAAFSPDGSKVIARYSNGSTWMFDATGGPGQLLATGGGEPLSWQRLALP